VKKETVRLNALEEEHAAPLEDLPSRYPSGGTDPTGDPLTLLTLKRLKT